MLNNVSRLEIALPLNFQFHLRTVASGLMVLVTYLMKKSLLDILWRVVHSPPVFLPMFIQDNVIVMEL